MKRAILAGCLAVSPAMAADPNDFEIFNYDLYNNGTVDIPGRLFVPDEYDSHKSYPLIIFLHGMGERGTDNTSQVNGNIDNLLSAAKSRDLFIYAPQTSGGWNPRSFMKQVANATTIYNIDTSRLYVTGLSMGGGGAWDTLIEYSDVIAAGVPICGVTPGATSYSPLVGEPIWVYHARNDSTVGVGSSRDRINDIRAADGGKPALAFPLNANPANPYYNTGSPYYADGSTFYAENNLRYTEYNSGGHGIWGRAYNEQAMYDWMLDQSTPLSGTQPGQAILFDLGALEQTTADEQGRRWNSTLNGEQSTLNIAVPFAHTADGWRTSVSLEVLTAAGKSETGHLAVDDLPLNVSGDSWLAYTHAATPQLRLHGLTPVAEYRLEFFGSHVDDDDGRGRVARFSVGAETIDLDLVGNIADTAVFESVFAGDDGTIDFTFAAAPGTRYAYVNWFSITEVPEPAGAMILLSGLMLVSRRVGRNRR